MRRMKLVAAVLMAGGLVFGVSSTAMAVGHDTKPAEAVPTATTVAATEEPTEEPTPATTAAQTTQEPTARPATTAAPAEKPATSPREAAPTARAARPVPANPDFTG